MYKIASNIFAFLTIVFASLFVTTRFLKKGFLLSKGKKDENQITLGANKNFLAGIFSKSVGIIAPLWLFFKIKSIIHDRKKAKKRRKFLAGTTLLTIIAVITKMIKAKNKS